MAFNTKKIGGGIVAVLVILGFIFQEVIKEIFISALADWAKDNVYASPAIATAIGYSPWVLLLVAGIMGLTGWGQNIHVRLEKPFFYRVNRTNKDHWTERREAEIYVLANVSAGVEPTASPVDKDPQLSRLRELKDAITRGELDARINGERPNAMSTVTLSQFKLYVAATNKPYWTEVLQRWEARQWLEIEPDHQDARMSLQELSKNAMDQGWKIVDMHSLDVLNFHKGLRQAGCDGHIRFWGRKQHGIEMLTRNEPLLEISKEYWIDNWLDQLALSHHDKRGNLIGLHPDNFVTHTLNTSGINRFADIYVDRVQAMRWLRTEA